LLAENAKDSFYEDEIRYGLEIALGGLFQLAIITFVALLLGIAKEVITIAISTALYRQYSGGAHCQAFYRCTLTSLVTFILLGYLSQYIPNSYWSCYIIFTVILSIIIIHRYVPVDNPRYKITDEVVREKRRQKSYVVVFLILLASALTSYFYDKELYSIALLLGLLCQDFTLSPWGANYICFLDNIFDKMEKILKRGVVT
jgi:Membrane protein putatively involved in post-translational modification of the autoinducing quorum-sensing peptide